MNWITVVLVIVLLAIFFVNKAQKKGR